MVWSNSIFSYGASSFLRGRSWTENIILLPIYLCLAMIEDHADPFHKPMSKAKIPVDPTASSSFPSAQLSAACGIISIDGLGPLDGDYVLLDGLASSQPSPVWVSTTVAYTQQMALSYLPIEAVWTFGAHGWSHAFVRVESAMPPSQSSRWLVFNDSSSTFEQVNTVVSISCPACTAVVVSALPKAVAPCDGPYRLQAGHSQPGIFMWSHVSDERCAMIHDKAGNSVVIMDDTVAQAALAVATHDVFASTEWWGRMVAETKQLPPVGDDTNVVCTSAGQTTRLVFELVDSRQVGLPAEQANGAGQNATSITPSKIGLKLSSRQDGSIISSVNSRINLRISRAKGLRQSEGIGRGVAGYQLDDIGGHLASKLRVKITIGGVVATSSLEIAAVQGFEVSLSGVEGTSVFEVCLFDPEEEARGKHLAENHEDCMTESVLILEVFDAETQVIQRRWSSEMKLSSNTMLYGVQAGKGGVGITRAVFLTGLETVDGYNLSTLNLMKNLPSNFRVSALDLSCASGELPVKDILDQQGLELFRLCIELPGETLDAAHRQGVTINLLLYSVLSIATTWSDVISARPDIAHALGDLYRLLAKFDVLVMSNGGRDADAFLLHVARLAGVGGRVVNLGAIAGGYMSPLFSGATSLIGPSHYVAHRPAVHRHAGELPIKVCHPVMDAARILGAALSCSPDIPEWTIKFPGKYPMNGGGGTSGAGNGELSPAKFIMVGRMSTEKTPGLFVRAMAVLQRRWVEWPKRGKRRTEGVMVGDGPLLRHMERLALQLDAMVHFMRFLPVDAVPCEVQQSTALVLPSTCSETFGMVGPEAMLLGVPVVTFGFGGSGELIHHMENGILVAEPTPRALADALELLARDAALRDRLGAQARQDALRVLSLSEMVACHADEFVPSAKRQGE